MGRGRRNYEQVTTNPDESNATDSTAAEGDNESPPRRNTTNRDRPSTEAALLQESPQGALEVSDTETASLADATEEEEAKGELVTVIILDVAQKKFPVKLSLHNTVQHLKAKGHAVHKVPSDRQRLIFQGRMLADDKTLAEEKIADQGIVHLFPKPRVLIQDAAGNKSVSRGNSTADETTDDAPGADEEEGGARVPTIIMNADEAQQRSQILVLGSADYLEASNNVKLFSFMLLIISSIELINLLAVVLGVPQENPNATYNNDYSSGDDIWDDDGMNNHTAAPGGGPDVPEWNTGNTFDFIISAMGVYVAIIGLKATTLNTLRLARTYLMGTFLTGVGWCLFNYVMTYKLDKEMAESGEKSGDDSPPMTDDDLAWQALTVMVLPCMVWMLCCLRAWQFQYLLREAEQEAEERIRSELANITGTSNGDEEGALPAESGTMA